MTEASQLSSSWPTINAAWSSQTIVAADSVLVDFVRANRRWMARLRAG